MPFDIGPVELILVLVIVAMLFGVGKLPEVFGAVGKGIREFRKEMGDASHNSTANHTQS
jgi:sec-independent protein translocase protein TatA